MSSRRPHHRNSAPLRIAGLIHLSRATVGISTLLAGGFAVWHRDANWLTVAGLCLLVWAVFALLHAFEASRVRCALCTGPLFSNTHNTKSRNARRLLWSYPLHTAVRAVFCSNYRCQHCGEQIACQEEAHPEPRPETSTPLPTLEITEAQIDAQTQFKRRRRASLPTVQRAERRPNVVLHAKTGNLKRG